MARYFFCDLSVDTKQYPPVISNMRNFLKSWQASWAYIRFTERLGEKPPRLAIFFSQKILCVKTSCSCMPESVFFFGMTTREDFSWIPNRIGTSTTMEDRSDDSYDLGPSHGVECRQADWISLFDFTVLWDSVSIWFIYIKSRLYILLDNIHSYIYICIVNLWRPPEQGLFWKNMFQDQTSKGNP